MRPTPSLGTKLQRLRLTTKQLNGGYYKGTGSGAMGRHTKHGGYVIEWEKVRTYVVPEGLAECKLSPFVTKVINTPKGKKTRLEGKGYLQRWKEENGTD